LVRSSNKPYLSIRLAPGLSDAEIERVQGQHGFIFPPDLRLLLQTALPLTDDPRDFPNWRDGDPWIHRSLEEPRSCVCYGVRGFGFWWDGWGERPASPKDASWLAYNAMSSMPRLIPIYGHRYVSGHPAAAGNPVM
ncbi:MAG TPA: hypothetical protein VD886_25390, partial [Herpetosiphonaceae bacterium]|nr:hypothetical protein [Herpetosiphonaceae bacterium]